MDRYPPHLLIHMGILRDGKAFRRATLQIARTMRIGFKIVDGALMYIEEDDRRWQELRDEGWVDVLWPW